MDRESTIRKLFTDDKIQFIIPPYQRAYSWGANKESDKDKQVVQFIQDLKEQKKKYFLGHFLFEKSKEDENTFFVIDGQQRLTTIVIFFSCFCKILEERVNENFLDKEGEPIELWRIKEMFLLIRRRRKFKTVDYDDNYFENLILDNKLGLIANTDSKRRIREARDYLLEALRGELTSEIIRWKEIIEDAVVTTFEVTDKIQATQIFGFQNDRGKGLTNLEKLKSFLMYQIYLNSEDSNSIDAIKYVEREFAEIYEKTERIEKIDEDQVLAHHCTAFLKGWDSPLENIKKELHSISIDNKEQWIKDFSTQLKNTFINVEQIERRAEGHSYIADVLILDAPNSWPLLLKLYHYHSKQNSHDGTDGLEDLFHLMEITLFKKDYAHSGWTSNEFNNYAKGYNGKIDDLRDKLLYASQNGFKWYWTMDANVVKYMQGTNHYDRLTRYLLWKYENSLRNSAKVAPILASEYLNKYGSPNLGSTIEHISPQSPDFTAYDEDFKINYLNNIGNLVLMSLGKNAQLSNADPIRKADGFQNSTLISQKIIGDIIKNKSKWGTDEIINRQHLLIEFAINKWKIKSSKI
jgi:hypothetical protein